MWLSVRFLTPTLSFTDEFSMAVSSLYTNLEPPPLTSLPLVLELDRVGLAGLYCAFIRGHGM